jgi:uncharacterized damage-inducible protein DinB
MTLEFQLDQAMTMLSRTPAVLDALLRGAPDDWTMNNNGGETWSPWATVGHILLNEETNYMTRARFLLEHGENRAFEPLDPAAMFEKYKGVALPDLLDRFAAARKANLDALRAMNLTPDRLALKGKHPSLGTVTLSQLLSTWVAHDFNHTGQIVEVMSRHYKEAVGPWTVFLNILTREG